MSYGGFLMIHISELLDSTLFGNFKIIAGSSGINNSMTNIVILEYESFTDSYEVFSAGDFVLSSLFFAKDNPHLIEEALLKLIKRHVSGIAILLINVESQYSYLKIHIWKILLYVLMNYCSQNLHLSYMKKK